MLIEEYELLIIYKFFRQNYFENITQFGIAEQQKLKFWKSANVKPLIYLDRYSAINTIAPYSWNSELK